jgi:hypothetical protein
MAHSEVGKEQLTAVGIVDLAEDDRALSAIDLAD